MPLPDDPTRGDIPPLSLEFQYQYVRGFTGDEAVVFELIPGRYELEVGFSEHETRELQLDVRAASGPIPQLPEAGG